VNVLFDTNVILDLMLDREPFAEPAARLLDLVERGDVTGWVCATTVTTIHYLATKALVPDRAIRHLENLMKLFHMAIVNRAVLEDALKSGFPDFEDGVVLHAARHAGAQAVVTRDTKGFERSDIPVYSPWEILNIIKAAE